MYHDSVRWTYGNHFDRFRDTTNKNFVSISKFHSQICVFAAREWDGESVYVFMTQYEAHQMMLHLQKLLNEK